MKVKLLVTVPGIGSAGAIVDVSDPQARNYLLPKKLAVIATHEVLKIHHDQEKSQAHQAAKEEASIKSLVANLENQTLHLSGKANAQGKLFAAIKTSDIQQAILQQFHCTLAHVTCKPDHLKNLGTHQVELSFHHHVVPITILIEHGT